MVQRDFLSMKHNGLIRRHRELEYEMNAAGELGTITDDERATRATEQGKFEKLRIALFTLDVSVTQLDDTVSRALVFQHLTVEIISPYLER